MADLVIRISGKIDDFEKALDKVQDKTEGLESKLSTIAKTSAVAWAALTGEVLLSAKAFGESEEISRRLTLALQNQGIYSKELEAQYNATAEAVQNLTGIDDDAIKAGMAKLQSMIGQTEVSKELTQAIADLSAEDGNLEGAFDAVGKAMQGNIKGLKAYGITIDENLSKQERMEKVIEIVNQRFGGQAEAANKGIGGLKGLQTAFGNLQEELGSRFAPAISTAIKSLTNFFDGIRQNQALVGFITDNIKLGTVLAGLALTISTAGIAFIKLKQAIEISSIAMKIFGTSTKAALVTSGIGLAVIALGEAFMYFSNKAEAGTKKADKAIEDHSANIRKLKSEMESLQKALPDTGGKPSYQIDYHTQQMANNIKAQLEMKKKSLEEEERLQSEFEQSKAKKGLGDNAAKKAEDEESRKLAVKRAQNETAKLEAENASAEMIALKKQEAEVLAKIEDDKYIAIREQLIQRLAEIKQLQEEQHAIDVEQAVTLNDEVLARNEEFQAMSEDQRQNFLLRNQSALQSQILTESTALELAAKNKLNQQIAANNQFLIEQQKYGTAVAVLDKALHSTRVNAARDLTGELVGLAQSENATLKAIGKAAAIAQITIATAESAVMVFKSAVEALPFPFGEIVGTALAGARIAFGVEQISKVQGAARGGLITGGIPGVDSVPVMAQQGELVSPRSNFEEVIGSVRAQREAKKIMGSDEGSGFGPGGATLVLSFKDGMMDFIEAQLIERKNLNLSLQGA